MASPKIVRCDCGIILRGSTDDQLVQETQQHAREHHNLELSRDQILAMAQPDPGR